MPFNKIHDLMDDAPTVPYLDTRHVTRAGLMLNTAARSKAVCLTRSDVDRLLAFPAPTGSLDMERLRDQGPLVVQFDGHKDQNGRFVIALLVVPMDEGDLVTCFPYSNNNEKGLMWPYDKHFLLSRLNDLANVNIQTRDTHPLAGAEDLDEVGKTHLAALSAIALQFLAVQQQDVFDLKEEDRDYSKLNKKRAKTKKSPFVNDNLLVWSK